MIRPSTRMRSTRHWLTAPPHPRADAFAGELNASRLLAQILLNRGIETIETAKLFLSPSMLHLHEPSRLPGAATAADCIANAIKAKKRIVIYGDYDVDGITASAILWHGLRLLGGDVHTYVPHRIDEGYGLNTAALEQLHAEGAQLVITVDCGVSAIEPITRARQIGLDVFVTDHHDFKTAELGIGEAGSDFPAGGVVTLPPATAIVHPRLPHDGPAYGNPNLCGAGVAFKLAWAVGQAINGTAKVSDAMRDFLREAIALAALGTVADVVPLTGENRVLARFGLRNVEATKLIGLQALIKQANLTGKKIDAYHVGFLLGPRLNAAGRMGHAKEAVELLTTATPQRAEEIAIWLDEQNRKRQATEREILADALAQAEALDCGGDCRGIVLAGEGWHPGVIGIVAARVMEKFHKPTIIIGINDGHGHGSGRSIKGFHLSRALQACTKHLQRHGGHEMAAGLGIAPECVEAFREAFLDHAAVAVADDVLVSKLRLDAVVRLEELDEPAVKELARLGPFGNANPRPLLAIQGAILTAVPRVVGKEGKHLQLYLRQGEAFMKAIAFNAAEIASELTPGRPLDLAVEPQLNEWQGRLSVELEVKDIVLG